MEKGRAGSPSMPSEAIVRDMVEGNILAMFNNETDAVVYADMKNNSDRAPVPWVLISSLIRLLEQMILGAILILVILLAVTT